MKPFFVFVFFVLTTVLGAQSLDVKWFDSNWNAVPTKSGAAYYRLTSMDSTAQHHIVNDYYVSGKLYRTASYIAMVPEIRDGKFTWYYSNGRLQKEVVYEGNKVVSSKLLNKKGEPELSVLLSFQGKNGEELSEPMKVDKEPSFVGGKKALAAFERKNLHYPPVTATEPIEGYVLVYFIVRVDGSLTDMKIARSLQVDVDNETLKYVSKMPRWNPALVGTTPVEVPYVLPIFFSNKSAQQFTRNNLNLP